MNKQSVKILLIEGNPEDANSFLAIQSGLPTVQLEWVHADRLNEVIHRLGEDRFDIILLDLSLSNGLSLETFASIRARAEKIPIVVVVNPDEQVIAHQALQIGAQDFLVKKEIDGPLLVRSLLCAIERHGFIDQLLQTHQQVLAQQNSLMEEDRFNSLLKMTGSTAHELKQPLTALLGNIELMKLNEDNPQERRGHISEIEKASKRISNLVNKIQEIRHQDGTSALNEPYLFHWDQKKNILSVEDTDDDFRIIEGCLKGSNQLSLSRVRSMKEALQCLGQEHFDLILLDYLLSDGNALDFMQIMAQNGLDIPVVVITGQGDEMIASKAIQAGAYDYLTKGLINKNSLLRAITYALEKGRLAKEVSQIQKKIVEMSLRDELTGLYNRRYMEEMFEIEFSRATIHRTELSCLIMDLDHFKQVNDSFGHAFGDFVLREFAACLKNSTRNSDWHFRYGGEEFMLLIPNTDIHGARLLAEKLRKKFEGKVYQNGAHSTEVTVSIGIASKNHQQPTRWEDLVAYADKALYAAKEDGRNCVRVFSE